MPDKTAAAAAHPNIAFIKYWGNVDPALNLPANGSISMNLACLQTTTQVQFDPVHAQDALWINDAPVTGPPLERVSRFLDSVRDMTGTRMNAVVRSRSNFPVSAGLASSASAFAALAVAAADALGLALPERELSALARLGSGSAARSVPGGFVEWYPGSSHTDSYAETIADPGYWDLVDVIAIVQEEAKSTTSSEGHILADTSPLQAVRAQTAEERLAVCRSAIQARSFEQLAAVVELDSNLMHAAMMTSRPALFYWEPATLTIMKSVPDWRKTGLQVCYTIDAGANVHLICSQESAPEIEKRIKAVEGVQNVLVSRPGGAARLTET